MEPKSVSDTARKPFVLSFVPLVFCCGETLFVLLDQMWSSARWRSPAVHRRHVDGTLHGPGGNAAISEHHRTGEIRNAPLPSNEANWKAPRHRWVSKMNQQQCIKWASICRCVSHRDENKTLKQLSCGYFWCTGCRQRQQTGFTLIVNVLSIVNTVTTFV